MDEEEKTPEKDILEITSLILSWINVVGMLVLTTLGIAGNILFRFMQPLFAKLNLPLPILTSLIMSVRPEIYGLVYFLIVAGLVFKERRLRNKSITLIINIVVMSVSLTNIFFYILVLFGSLIIVLEQIVS